MFRISLILIYCDYLSRFTMESWYMWYVTSRLVAMNHTFQVRLLQLWRTAGSAARFFSETTPPQGLPGPSHNHGSVKNGCISNSSFLSFGVHPGRLAWNLQITHLERKMIFQTSMMMVHVNLPGCSFPLPWLWEKGYHESPENGTLEYKVRSLWTGW